MNRKKLLEMLAKIKATQAAKRGEIAGLMEKSLSSGQDIFKGLALIPPHHLKNQPKHHGRLFFQNEELSHKLPESLPGNKADNSILATALALQKKFKS